MAQDYISKEVGAISFSLLSPKEVKKIACAKIVTPELYDKEGYPVDGGLMDIRLGVIDPGLRCKTCGEKLKECMGHFGYTELARPIIHVKHAKTILDFLRSTCRECGRILMSDAEREKAEALLDTVRREQGGEAYRRKVASFISDLKLIKKCPHCTKKQYEIKQEKPTNYYEADKRLSPIEVRTRLERIPDKDCPILGMDSKYARPEWMVLTVLQIPPVTMRPSITLESGERSEDDLTHKMGDIIRINQRLFENINAGAPEIIVEDLWDLLQYHITTYFDNTLTSIPPARHRSGQPLKTLVERIKSKEGRFRHNLAGKRVNFAARTVISPDSKLKLNEVGVPQDVATILTVPERVTEWNLQYLKKFVEHGPTVYPGCNYVISPDGKKKKVTEETKPQLMEELAVGYQVERHLLDEDIAIFNRQPSLHKMSIMCHKIRVLPGRSFRLNPAVCDPYNADFDGDEMNLHIPQTEEARAEAELLMQVQTQIITPKNGYNVVGCIEDSISGNYLLTKQGTFTKEEAVRLLVSIGVEDLDAFARFKETVSGREVFSALLPKDFNYSDDEVTIKNGQLSSGVITGRLIGEGGGDLLRALFLDYRDDRTLEILGGLFRLGVAYLLYRGFTTAISDTDLPESIRQRIEVILKETEKKVEEHIQEYRAGNLEAFPGKTIEETLELLVLQLLNKVRNRIGDVIAEYSTELNPTIIMARSGAKGNILNLAQMAACVGQQALRGKRIEKGYQGRTLSMFGRGNLEPDAHGFIRRGFKDGLKPVEFFFGAMTGRDSLMDTALRTPKSGYLYRRLANAMQDLKVEYDFTVRDANKNIVQFLYGDDGIDISKSEGGKINVKKIVRNAKR